MDLAQAEESAGEHLRVLVWDALFSEGDTLAAAAAVDTLAASLREPERPPQIDQARLENLCVAGLWHADRGDATAGEAYAARLKAAVPRDSTEAVVCSGILDAVLLARRRAAGAGAAVPRLGDREKAILAYRLYLAMRSNPEPELMPEVERVRAELARLMQEERR